MKNKIFRALDEKTFDTENMSLQFFIRENEKQYFFELSGFSPAGEDYCEEFEMEKSDVSMECEQLSKQLWSIYEDFDPEDHAVMWYQAGDRGQPKSLRFLLNDAYAIEKCLEETCKGADQFIAHEKQKNDHVMNI